MIKHWISAFRLRTLPLAFSCIIAGSALAYKEDVFDVLIFSLGLLTTLFLQVLSNLANDYGDADKGTDNDNRVGPKRAIQSGAISKSQMKKAIVVFVVLSLVTGLILVFYATRNLHFLYPVGFITLGLLAIMAAIKYTAGDSAYGYKGLGDLFVFVFFGCVGVGGSYFLYSAPLKWEVILPMITIGTFSSAVLNLNNMRDWENDKACGKNTLVVLIGFQKAKAYHFGLLLVGFLSAALYILYYTRDFTAVLALTSVAGVLLVHLIKVLRTKVPYVLDAELKKIALTTFFYAITLWWI